MAILASLNINGLNNKFKQQLLANFLKINKVDILFFQEHNIRSEDCIVPALSDNYYIYLNLAIAHKGGTGILIDKSLNIKIKNCEKSANSRIMSMNIELYSKPLHLINIYAPSGSNHKVRDDFFKDELTYYFRNNLDNSIIGGDFNCITSSRDSSSESTHVCKTLSNINKDLALKDAWWLHNRAPEFTFVRSDYGSRIDRFYIKKLANYINNVKVKHTSLSDHSSILLSLDLPNVKTNGPYYWKMNTSLLDDKKVREDFTQEWDSIKCSINRYDSINIWWELCAKKRIKSFFIKKGKEINQQKYGLLNYLEYNLNRLYNKNNIEHKIDYSQVRYLKNRINEIKSNILEGVKIRCRIEEQLKGETVSTFLIKKQAETKKKQLIQEIKSEENVVDNLNEGIILNTKDSIDLYIRNYYTKLYKDEPTDENQQKFFLNLVENRLDNQDKDRLGNEITEQEIHTAIKDLNRNKAPGIDGIPIEFYQTFWQVIKFELINVIRNISTGTLLENNQRKAIITLIPKGSDQSLLKNWRPVSLICCDVKIV